ncbi:MAG: hypothetical protein RLZZ153_1561 [Pseudomonadota bacterium]|jgi:hypothetical protein
MKPAVSDSVRQWLHHRGLPTETVQASSPLAVVFDRVRVSMHPRPAGLLLETQLSALPAAPAARDSLLERALRTAAARVRHQAATLGVDDAAGALWLQQLVPHEMSVEALDEVVGALVNETEYWRSTL